MFTIFNTLRRFGLIAPESEQPPPPPQQDPPKYAPQSANYPYLTHKGLIEENPNFALPQKIDKNISAPTEQFTKSTHDKMKEIQQKVRKHLAQQDANTSPEAQQQAKVVDETIRKGKKKTSKKARKIAVTDTS